MVGVRGALWRRRHWNGSGAENFDLLNIWAQLTHTTVKSIYIYISIYIEGNGSIERVGILVMRKFEELGFDFESN